MRRRGLVLFLCLVFMLQGWGPLLGQAHAEGSTESWTVSFQPHDVAVADGVLPDHGEAIGSRNGYVYGWNRDITANTVTRATYGASAVHSFVMFEHGDVWEFQLASGFYDVSVTVGDSVYGSLNTVWVEDMPFFEQEVMSAGQSVNVTHNVFIDDGALTVHQGPSGNEQTRLNQIKIVKTADYLPPDPDVMIPPVISTPHEARTAIGNKVLISGKMNNPHQAPPHLYIAGLQEEIDSYMNDQMEEVRQATAHYVASSIDCSGCRPTDIQQLIQKNEQLPVIRAGHLNLESNAQFGTAERPAIVIVDGINTNRPLTLEIYGTLIVRNNLNANQALNILVHSSADDAPDGHLWIMGTLHLNQDSSVQTDNQFFANQLTFNNGNLHFEAKRILVADQTHINTRVNMLAAEEIAFGKLISNNSEALLKVEDGDFFVRDQVNVNNQLAVETGGWFAIGGNLTANQRPSITTGMGNGKGTLLKFKLHGLLAEYFSEPSFTGDKLVKIDETIDFNQTPRLMDSSLTDNGYAVRWTGQIQPRYSERYTFSVEAKGNARLWVNGEEMLHIQDSKLQKDQGSIALLAGKRYDIQLEYDTGGNTMIRLHWESNSQAKEIVPHHRLHPFAKPELSTSATETSITLNWSPVFHAENYDVEIDGTIVTIGKQPIYTHDSLSPGTMHQYRVRAIYDDMVGEWSTLLTSWTLPDVPQGIKLTSTDEIIRLEWDPVTGATGYDIEVDQSVVDNGDALFFEMNNLNPNIQKAFRVRAKNSSGAGQWSPIVVRTTVVGVPGNLRGIPTDTEVALQWDPVSGADAYDLEIDGVILEGLTNRTYLHENVQPNTEHVYRVRAKNDHGTGRWSESLRVLTKPSIPGNLQAATSNTEIWVTWDAVAGAVTYELEIDGEILNQGLQTEFRHTDLVPNTEHVYRVRARNTETVGAWSPPLVAVTLAGIPTHLQTTATSTSITLTWNSVIGAGGYDVEVDGEIVDNGLRTTYEHVGLEPLSEHRYRVRATSRAGAGEWSEYVHAQTVLGQPVIRVTEVSPSSISLAWDAVPGAQSYELMADGQVIDVGAATTYTDQELQPSSWHYYRVRAKNGSVIGEWSESVTQTTRLGKPKITDVIAESRSIWLQWERVVGADSYELEADGQVIDVGESLTFLHKPLSPNSRHTYRVRAKNSDSVGAWSDWSVGLTKQTPPDTPTGITFEAATDAITMSWNSVTGASSYEVEADGVVKSGISETSFTLTGLTPNTMHVFRVRTAGSGGTSGWTELYRETTIPELKFNVGKDTSFHFVIVAPAKPEALRRQITVTYHPDELEVLDLFGLTPTAELQPGKIEGTDFTIIKFEDGQIVYHVENASKTIFNLIQFRAKVNDYTNITYTIE